MKLPPATLARCSTMGLYQTTHYSASATTASALLSASSTFTLPQDVFLADKITTTKHPLMAHSRCSMLVPYQAGCIQVPAITSLASATPSSTSISAQDVDLGVPIGITKLSLVMPTRCSMLGHNHDVRVLAPAVTPVTSLTSCTATSMLIVTNTAPRIDEFLSYPNINVHDASQVFEVLPDNLCLLSTNDFAIKGIFYHENNSNELHRTILQSVPQDLHSVLLVNLGVTLHIMFSYWQEFLGSNTKLQPMPWPPPIKENNIQSRAELHSMMWPTSSWLPPVCRCIPTMQNELESSKGEVQPCPWPSFSGYYAKSQMEKTCVVSGLTISMHILLTTRIRAWTVWCFHNEQISVIYLLSCSDGKLGRGSLNWLLELFENAIRSSEDNKGCWQYVLFARRDHCKCMCTTTVRSIICRGEELVIVKEKCALGGYSLVHFK
ncbi:hypothetical protein SETIT_2G144600v2 [Setaria italica]|uniref:Uncharacterized protein n=1 Tax=Setaria italica TaxID=4555 RepID=A0A368PZ35_SETIT|nr:hypothetical protein SETIT_2G144600v2 [Setaria italica]